jgi:predicted amidohydrolase YtcJ
MKRMLVLACVFATAKAFAQAPDLVLVHGRIATLDAKSTVAESHAIRAALSFSTEVNWIGTRSVAEALARLREAAKKTKPGAWLIVAGGWTPEQFAEKRAPIQDELVDAGPDNRVYVQLFYRWAMLTPNGFAALGIREDKDVPPAGCLERDTGNHLTGGIAGYTPTITALFARLPKPSFEEQVEGTKKFFSELNRLGLTGVIDFGRWRGQLRARNS